MKSFPCTRDGCDKQFSRRNILNQHIDAIHKGIRIPYPECSHPFRYANDLREHQSSKHMGLRPHHCHAEPLNLAGCTCSATYPTRSALTRHYKARAKAILSNNILRAVDTCSSLETISSASPEQIWDTYAMPSATARTISPVYTGLMLPVEQTLLSIHNYVTYCWGSRRWFIHRSGFASSNCGPQGQDPRLLLPFNSVLAALSAREPHVAEIQLAIASQAAQTAIGIEHPVCFLDMFLMHLEIIAMKLQPQWLRSCAVAVHKRLLMCLGTMAMDSRNPMHPWVRPIAYLFNLGYGEQAKQSLLQLGKLLLNCMTKAQPPGSPACRRMQLLFAKYEDTEGKQLREEMLRSSAETISSSTHLAHIQPTPFARTMGPAPPKSELGVLSQELMKDERNITCHSSGKLLNLKWAYQAAVAARQWPLAANLIAEGILPIYEYL